MGFLQRLFSKKDSDEETKHLKEKPLEFGQTSLNDDEQKRNEEVDIDKYVEENTPKFGQLGLNDDGQKTNEEVIQPVAALGFPWRVGCLAISSDGQLLAISTGPGIVVLQVDTGEIVDAWEIGCATQSLSFSPNGERLAYVEFRDDNVITMRGMANNTSSYNIESHTNSVRCLDFHPDGILVSGDNDGVIRVTRSHHDGEIFLSGESSILALKFSQDGKFLLSVDDSVKMWDFNNNKLLYTIELPDISDVTFAPDGQTFAISGRPTRDNGFVSFYQTGDGQLLTTLDSIKDDYSMNIAISPDSKLLTVSNKVWNKHVESFVYELKASSIWGSSNKVFSPTRNLLMVSGDKPGGWRGWSEGGVLFYCNDKLSFTEEEIKL